MMKYIYLTLILVAITNITTVSDFAWWNDVTEMNYKNL